MSRKFIDGRHFENIGDGVLIENGRITIVYAGTNRLIEDPALKGIAEFVPYENWKDIFTNTPTIHVEIEVEYEEVTFILIEDGKVDPIGRVSVLLMLLNNALKP